MPVQGLQRRNPMSSVQDAFEKTIRLAIRREREAYKFYNQAAKNSQLSFSAKLLQELAQREVAHREKLKKALEEGVCETFACSSVAEVNDLRLSNYLLEIPLRSDSSPQEVLQVAMKREQASHEFYKALSGQTTHTAFRVVFEVLAREELDHKNRLEKMYEDIFMPEM